MGEYVINWRILLLSLIVFLSGVVVGIGLCILYNTPMGTTAW